MLDYRISTFLTLCQQMNYRKTAEKLLMTQPAVTQHIHGLEQLYGCKLFHYEGKTLTKTAKAEALEVHARAMMATDLSFRKQIATDDVTPLSVGATKTIGDYVATELVMQWLQDARVSLHFTVDNTARLFEQLHAFALDFLMIEGYFDKSQYDYQLIQQEELVGICALDHPFAGKQVAVEDLFDQHLILRESGSGTRMVFERFLTEQNFSFAKFKKTSTISSFLLIQQAICRNLGVSFVYASIPAKNANLATFRIKNHPIFHELNYVFLKNSHMTDFIAQRISL